MGVRRRAFSAAALLLGTLLPACSRHASDALPPIADRHTTSTTLVTVQGPIVGLYSNGFEINGANGCGHLHIYTSSTTVFTPSGAKPAIGLNSVDTGTGGCATSLTATAVTLTAPSPSPSASPGASPGGSPTPSSTPSLPPSSTPSPAPSPTPTLTPTPSAHTIPYFQSSFIYGGVTYISKIVGTDPIANPVTTTINAQVVPVRLVFSDGTVLDGGPQAGGIPNSPLFTSNAYPAGTTQYGDAFMRSEFWKYAANSNYHVLLNAPVMEPAVEEQVPSTDGYVKTVLGITTGYVTYAWFVQKIEPQIITQLGLDPSTLTIFATASTKVLEPGNGCCFGGYHSVFSMNTAAGPALYTTAWASVTSSSVETLSHEVAEWLDDPFYKNYVPPWAQPGETVCGGKVMEAGDPVTQYAFDVGGWQMQDETFYSWFTRTSPSIGINGQYDLMGRLSQPASSC